MTSRKNRIGAICFRIVVMANLLAIMIYGAITPHQMAKVTAEIVTIAVTAFAMAVQVFLTIAFFCLRCSVWIFIGLDGLCAAGWVAAIAVLSYWDLDVVYKPRGNDPSSWFQCYRTGSFEKVLTTDGWGHWIKILWCEVEVNGQDRLIGNGAARQQLPALIGLSTVALLFTGILLIFTIWRARDWGLIGSRKWVTRS